MALAAYAKERVGLPARVRPADVQGGRRSGRRSPRATSSRARASTACTRATRSVATTPGWTTSLLVALTEKRTPADIDRLADVLAEVCG